MRRLAQIVRLGPVGILTLAAAFACLPPGSAAAAGMRSATGKGLRCDISSIKSAFKHDANTTVLFVGKVKKGQSYPNATMEQFVYPDVPAVYEADLCHVKLLVGPGNPGPAHAPSTSRGIGIEVWLPAKSVWNHTVHAVGGSGWQNGTEETLPNKISSWTGAGGDIRAAPRVAAEEGSVTSTTDSGYPLTRSGSFLAKPDGSFNTRALRDWVYRALYEQAVKTKDLAAAYYGSPPKYSFFDGASGGGHEAFAVVENLPDQYNGVLARVAVLNWNERIARLYPALVIEHDLDGKPLSAAQLDLVSNAAIAACDVENGQHVGFIIDNASCRYDPTKDKAVLCKSAGGENGSAACVTRKQALAINKVWYGITKDGSVPDPAVDNGWDFPPTGVHLWYGEPRGSSLTSYFTLGADGVAADDMAAVLGNPKLGSTGFKIAAGTGENAWKRFSYAQLAQAFEKVRATEPKISSNNPDLSAFKAHGGKLMFFVDVDDNAVLSISEVAYYERVIKRMGGLSSVQPFFRMYLLPGLDHGPWNGTSNPRANPPQPARGQLYQALVNWVEQGTLPTDFVVTSGAVEDSPLDRFYGYKGPKNPKMSLPVCAYPTIPTYVGADPSLGSSVSGSIFKASSYVCK